MPDVFAGCLLERLPNPKAAEALPFFEYAPRAPLPALATLARYRKQFRGGPPRIALVAPRGTWMTPRGAMRPGPELDAGLDWLKRAADILEVFAIVLPTGAELSTGERDSGLLAEFARQLRSPKWRVVVAPRGLWDPEQAIPFAAKTGTVYGFDPLEHPAPPGDFVYGRVHPMGARPRLTEGHFAQIAERIAETGSEQAYVSVESERPLADMKRLARFLAESLEAAALLEQDEETDEEGLDEDEAIEGEGESLDENEDEDDDLDPENLEDEGLDENEDEDLDPEGLEDEDEDEDVR